MTKRTRYADHDFAETQVWSAYRGINARSEAGLPGAVERGDCKARIFFTLEGREAIRYFADHASALRAKKSYRGTWRPANVHYWNFKELIWM